MDKKATDRQQDVLNFISSFQLAYGTPPSFRDIQDGLSLKSVNGVTNLLKRLEAKGLLTWQRGKRRTIHLDPAMDTAMLVRIQNRAVPMYRVLRSLLATYRKRECPPEIADLLPVARKVLTGIKV